MKILNIYENLWNTMKVLRGHEASLESSKGFYKGSMSIHTDYHLCSQIYENLWKSKVIYGNPWKAMKIAKIYEKKRKSSEDKKPATATIASAKRSDILSSGAGEVGGRGGSL